MPAPSPVIVEPLPPPTPAPMPPPAPAPAPPPSDGIIPQPPGPVGPLPPPTPGTVVPVAGPMPTGTASTIIASQPQYVPVENTTMVPQYVAMGNGSTIIAAAPQLQYVPVDNGTTLVAAAAPQAPVQTAAPQILGTFQQTQVGASQVGLRISLACTLLLLHSLHCDACNAIGLQVQHWHELLAERM